MKKDLDTLSIRVSSGLGGTINTVRIDASAISEADVDAYERLGALGIFVGAILCYKCKWSV